MSNFSFPDIYYLSFPKDKIPLSLLVYSVVVFEGVQTVLVTRDTFRFFTLGFNEVHILNEVAWRWFSIPVMTALVSCTVQIFFCWRVYTLSRRVWLPGVVSFLSLTQAVAGVWSGVRSGQIGKCSQIADGDELQTAVWLGGTALVDTVITVSMIYYLLRSRNGFKVTNALITKIVRLTVETGLICSTVAIVEVAGFLVFKKCYYHEAPAAVLSKLYSNSLLVLLNSRMRIVGGRNSVGNSSGVVVSIASRLVFASPTDISNPTNDLVPSADDVVIDIAHPSGADPCLPASTVKALLPELDAVGGRGDSPPYFAEQSCFWCGVRRVEGAPI